MEDKELSNEEVNIPPKVNISLILAIGGIIMLCLGVAILSYKQGVKDTERVLKEPQINLSLVPDIGMIQVIPLKLTAKGIGIRFNIPVTNLTGIGIDFANK